MRCPEFPLQFGELLGPALALDCRGGIQKKVETSSTQGVCDPTTNAKVTQC